jgi:uncharacterized protein (TIGR00730 family)
MGKALLAQNIGLVYGGGRLGLMGIVADAVMEGNGEVIGIIPKSLVERELAHQGITELLIVRSMHERKAAMAERADAFIALPGGYGTLEEFCEIITWAQLGLHEKPCGILNVEGYYNPLLSWFDHAVAEGFLAGANRRMIIAESEPERLLNSLMNYSPSVTGNWINPNES